MNRWPRTAAGQRQRTDGASTFFTRPATGSSQPSSGPDSPRGVINGVPQPPGRSAKAAWVPVRAGEGGRQAKAAWTPGRPLEGHAQDVLHLLDASWFGPLNKSAAPAKAAEEEEWQMPEPRPRGRRAQRDERGSGERGADTSPPTSGSTASQQSSQRSAASGAQPLRLPAPTPAQGIASRRDAAAAAAVQDLPGIGTWAGRYRLFGRRQEEQQEEEEEQRQQGAPTAPARAAQAEDADAESAAAALLLRGDSDSLDSPVVLRPGGIGAGTAEGSSRGQLRRAIGSQEMQEEAWRWRFSRKWATEQARFYEEGGAAPSSLVYDDLDALACGVGVNLQVQQPTSAPRRARNLASAAEEGTLGAEGSASALSLCQFDGADASYMSGGILGADMSPGNSAHGARAAAGALQRAGSGAGTPGISRRGSTGGVRGRGGGWQPGGPGASPRGPSATSGVLAMAHKARDLLQKQGAIEAEVQDRWERTRRAGDTWVGASLAPVTIDSFGRFKYCLLRISDGAGHTRFLVRGRAGATPDTILEGVRGEAAAASRSGGLPAAYVEVVGGGVMEWREDTERELHLQPSALVGAALQQQRAASDSPTKTPYLSDVSGLTASLVRQALPCHFRITTGANAASRGNLLASNNRI